MKGKTAPYLARLASCSHFALKLLYLVCGRGEGMSARGGKWELDKIKPFKMPLNRILNGFYLN